MMFLSSELLKEPSNIAHSGLLLLALVGAAKLSLLLFPQQQLQEDPKLIIINGLTAGILSMQRFDDGAFQIQFPPREADDDDDDDDSTTNVYKGIGFYPGEAMVGLMEVYMLSTTSSSGSSLSGSGSSSRILDDSVKEAIIPSMMNAFRFYENYYHQYNPDINYNIWQIQAFARLYHVLVDKDDQKQQQQQQQQQQLIHHDDVAKYVLDLCNDIIESTSWKLMNRLGKYYYPNLQSVEIACGLDSLMEGIHVVESYINSINSKIMGGTKRENDDDLLLFLSRLIRAADNAIDYLMWVQDLLLSSSSAAADYYGGIGYGGLHVTELRLDVTGHTLSAVTKYYDYKFKQQQQQQQQKQNEISDNSIATSDDYGPDETTTTTTNSTTCNLPYNAGSSTGGGGGTFW